MSNTSLRIRLAYLQGMLRAIADTTEDANTAEMALRVLTEDAERAEEQKRRAAALALFT